jgi:RNA polymerase sigma-70 factor, ECF subfamily
VSNLSIAEESEERQRDLRDMGGLATGDPEALERLHRRYSSKVAGFFWRMGGRNLDTQDLLHETFLRLWRGGKAWRGEGRLSTYLFSIARSAWIDSKRARRDLSIEELAFSERSAGPDLQAERSELREKIEEAMAELSEPLRLVFSMSTGAGLKYREIAETLAIPLGTVKSRMAAAEEKLRLSLSKYIEGGV